MANEVPKYSPCQDALLSGNVIHDRCAYVTSCDEPTPPHERLPASDQVEEIFNNNPSDE